LRDLISETKRAGIREVEVLRDVQFPSRVAAALQLPEAIGTMVRRTRTMDGRPFSFTVNHLPPRYGEMVSEEELRGVGLMTLLERKGVTFTGATQAIRAQLADVEVSRALGIEFGAPVLFVERLLLATRGEPCELVHSWYRGDMYEYRVQLEAGKEARDLRSHLA